MKNCVKKNLKSKGEKSVEHEISSENGKQNRQHPPAINWEKIWERMEDEDLIKDVAEDFLLQNSERLELLLLAVNSNNLANIVFYSHSIKGAASTIAADEVTAAAANLEMAANTKQISQIEPLFTELKQKFENLSSLISRPHWIDEVRTC